MTILCDNSWEELEKTRLEAGSLAARIVDPELTERMLFAIGSDGSRHFLISLGEQDTPITDKRSRGLIVTTEEMTVNDRPTGSYINIACVDKAGYHAFDLIGHDFLRLLGPKCATPAEVVARVLSKWRRFWANPPKHVLSREEIVGLFGELWFLEYWLIPRIGAKAVSSWEGPRGGRHDFCWPKFSIEVKATTSSRGRVHQIHGVDQLLPPDNGELYLFSLHIRDEPTGSKSLVEIIDDCSRLIASNPDALSLFEQCLFDIRYSPMNAQEYEGIRFALVEQTLFAVRDDFPRLLAVNYQGGFPPAIEAIDYTINLNSYDHLCVATRPEQVVLFND